MDTLATILSITSGFFLMGYRLPSATIVGTSIAINLALAPLTAVIASRRGRNVRRWILGGLAFGMWSLATILILPAPNRKGSPRPEPPSFPPPSDAA